MIGDPKTKEALLKNQETEADAMKAEQDARAKRAALFDKLVSDRSSAPNTAFVETKTPATKVATSVKELLGPQRAADRGIKFGAAREKAAKMKELESSFTETTKEDIAKANKDVKKPIIGRHRK